MDKVIVVTGSSKGVGAHLRDHYLLNGWRVFGCSRAAIDFSHQGYTHFTLDVVDEQAVVQMVQAIYKSAGRIDALINNAGVASMNHALLTTLSTVQSTFGTNVFGSFLFAREVAKIMVRQQQGRIVNVSSIASPLALEGESIYAASKAALESMTRTFAKDLASYGITVNAVGATPIKTDLTRGVPVKKMDALINRQPIPRWGECADVENAIDFFLQASSDFVTGQVLYLGGVS